MTPPEPSDSPRAFVVLSSAPDAPTAQRLASGLVEARAAACVTQLPAAQSVYRWQGAIEQQQEVLLLIKTDAAGVRRVESWLAAEHPYDVPECIALPAERVAPAYLAWLLGEVAPSGGA